MGQFDYKTGGIVGRTPVMDAKAQQSGADLVKQIRAEIKNGKR